MATMTFRMDSQKNLVCTTTTTIYQNESGVDTVNFLLPIKYDELDIADCIVAIEYADPANVTHVEILKKDEELYNDQYYKYGFPITSEFTKIPGEITFVLEIIKDNGAEGSQVMRLAPATVKVSEWKDYMMYLPDENLSPMEKRVQIIEDLNE